MHMTTAHTMRAIKPWKVNQTRTGIMEAGSGAQIATMRDGWPKADAEAHMALIVAAPALLAALEAFHAVHADFNAMLEARLDDESIVATLDGRMDAAAAQAEAAIALARGEA